MSVVILIAVVASAIGFLASGAILQNHEHFVIAYGFAAAIPTSAAAAFQFRRDVFSPMNMLNYLTLMSLPVFLLYIHFVANEDRFFRKMYGLEMVELYPGITLVLYGLLFVIAGFHVAAAVNWRAVPALNFRSSKSRIHTTLLVAVLAAILAGLFYARDVGLGQALQDGGNIAAKRVHEATQGVAPRGSALTHWRLLGYIFPHAIIVATLAMMWTGTIRRTRIDTLLLGSLLAVSLFIPFIAGSREPIFSVLLILIIVRHYAVTRLTFRKLFIFGVIGLFALGLLGQLRSTAEVSEHALSTRILGVFEEIVGASYFMDASKNAIIVREVPENVEHLNGSSLVSIAIAFIPRQIWPEKPIVRVGFFVGQEVIRLNNQTGIPPGFIAELYLNFGYALIPVFMIVVGATLRLSYDAAVVRRTPLAIVTYAVSMKVIVLSLMSTDLTFAIFSFLTLMTPIWIFMWLLSNKNATSYHMRPMHHHLIDRAAGLQ